jgi:hypothetical protein
VLHIFGDSWLVETATPLAGSKPAPGMRGTLPASFKCGAPGPGLVPARGQSGITRRLSCEVTSIDAAFPRFHSTGGWQSAPSDPDCSILPDSFVSLTFLGRRNYTAEVLSPIAFLARTARMSGRASRRSSRSPAAKEGFVLEEHGRKRLQGAGIP